MSRTKTQADPAKRGRPASSSAIVTDPPVAVALQADFAASDAEVSRLAQVDATYGLGIEYDRNRVEGELRALAHTTAQGMLRMGQCLLLLKEHEVHGEFMGVIGRLGMNYRTAARMMQASVKFAQPLLADKNQSNRLLMLPQTKLFELMVEDDAALTELAEGGTIAGLELDDIEAMSVRELRFALRDARADAVAQEDLLATKNKKIDSLTSEKKKRRLTLADWQLELVKLTEESGSGSSNVVEIMAAMGGLPARAEEEAFSADATQDDHAVRFARAHLADVEQVALAAAKLLADARAWCEPLINNAPAHTLDA
jgi:hypothetical protein